MTDEFISPSNLKRHHTSISCYVWESEWRIGQSESNRIATKYLWEWKTISNSANLNELIPVMITFRIDWNKVFFGFCLRRGSKMRNKCDGSIPISITINDMKGMKYYCRLKWLVPTLHRLWKSFKTNPVHLIFAKIINVGKI